MSPDSNDNTPLIGIDVGSTTVKCVVVDPQDLTIIWCDHARHEIRQAETTYDLLDAAGQACPPLQVDNHPRIYITGSGAKPLVDPLGARFVQEVNAVTLAVEHLHPEVNSVVELGGQDAKVIIFKAANGAAQSGGERHVITSMNDKCASGTGAILDKCMLKVGLDPAAMTSLTYDPSRLHSVAAKCGVFAETDIVNLVKAGVPANEIMNSLAAAIVRQDLSVLSRGNTLTPHVLLLGGPNTYFPFLRAAFREQLLEIWRERGVTVPDIALDALIRAPQHALYYAALGSVIFGTAAATTDPIHSHPIYRGLKPLRDFIAARRDTDLADLGPPLTATTFERDAFINAYEIPAFTPKGFPPGTTIRAYLGIDGGSTSSKAVLMDADLTLLTKTYLLSGGNPIEDIKTLLERLRAYAQNMGCMLEILGCGVTGYASEVLSRAIGADLQVVETIAHMHSALHYCGDNVDVICDIGGQDIKVLFMQNGAIKNFRLSNQCSAGNGMLLQAMAHQFGVEIEDYAEIAFAARSSPEFSYGCAVFLDTDRVNFQKDGYTREAIFAGLARVLPKNIWQYVVQAPRLAEFGRKFVLQGGTQYNLAALKAQVDYIKARVPDAEILVHPHCGEGGAIGAALAARDATRHSGASSFIGPSNFIGIDAAIDLKFSTRTDESTRCNFCTNTCARTFVDLDLPSGTTRHIAGFACAKGTVESRDALRSLTRKHKRLAQTYPNLADFESTLVFRHLSTPPQLPDAGTPILHSATKWGWFGSGKPVTRTRHSPFTRSSEHAATRRANVRIGIPRSLNIYTHAPFMRGYLETLGVPRHHIVFSDYSSEDLYNEGGKLGSIDPCFPAKITLAHVHNLLHKKHQRTPLDYLWLPSITNMPSFVKHTVGNATCPVVAGTPSVVNAAFTKERDYFADAGVDFVHGALNFADQARLKHQLYALWGERLRLSRDESDFAVDAGSKAMTIVDAELEHRGLTILQQAERDHSVVILLLGRPYHLDPGINHDICAEFQALGYPIITIRSIPKDRAYLAPIFAEDIAHGYMADPFDVRDVWPENFSVNSVQKVWAAKFAARHKNVAVLDLSNFKCGHDAPTYGLIDNIIKTSKTPYQALHDLDANKPGGSISIRVKTFSYTLEKYRAYLQDQAAKTQDLALAVAAKRRELNAQLQARHLEIVADHTLRETVDAIYAEVEEHGSNQVISVDFRPQRECIETEEEQINSQGQP